MAKQKEGRRLRTISPMTRVAVYIMKKRHDASNLLADTVNIDRTTEYIARKRAEGLKGFGMMHVFMSAYIRTISQYPGINRFIRGQTIYARNGIEMMITIKREMTLNAEETVLKIDFTPDMTAPQVYDVVKKTVETSRSGESDFDDTAKILNHIPGLVLKFTVWFFNLLDYFGLLPRKLTKLSPFHGSFAVTSMGSLGIPPIYHHLYDFGNIPVFCAFGPKYVKKTVLSDGTVEKRKYLDYKATTDERICDGHYYAAALKYFKGLIANPSCLDEPPAEVRQDID